MTPYDQVAYPATPFLQCHPERLAVMGRLFGLTPAPVEGCRVLEIGCGDGLNLIAEAITLPQSEFVGIDLSYAAIDRGRVMIGGLELTNVRLAQQDLRNFDEDSAGFDYVIAHGVYSWVPEDARDSLLGVIKRCLTPRGIAFVSYNAYPGAYMPQMLREMALRSGQPIEWLESVRTFACGSPLYRTLISDEAANMLKRNPGFLAHDDLAEVYWPVYFRDFITHASANELQFVCEADLGAMGKYGLPVDAALAVDQTAAGDRLAQEQLADFLLGRRFRQTLLCHASSEIRDSPDASALGDCFAGAPIAIEGDEFLSQLGGRLRTADTVLRSMLRETASAWPGYVPMQASAALLELFAARMIDVRLKEPPAAIRIGSRPRVSSLVRFQVERGLNATSLHHLKVAIESNSLRALLLLMDGTRTRAALIHDLARVFPSASKEQVIAALDVHLQEALNLGLLCRN